VEAEAGGLAAEAEKGPGSPLRRPRRKAWTAAEAFGRAGRQRQQLCWGFAKGLPRVWTLPPVRATCSGRRHTAAITG